MRKYKCIHSLATTGLRQNNPPVGRECMSYRSGHSCRWALGVCGSEAWPRCDKGSVSRNVEFDLVVL